MIEPVCLVDRRDCGGQTGAGAMTEQRHRVGVTAKVEDIVPDPGEGGYEVAEAVIAAPARVLRL